MKNISKHIITIIILIFIFLLLAILLLLGVIKADNNKVEEATKAIVDTATLEDATPLTATMEVETPMVATTQDASPLDATTFEAYEDKEEKKAIPPKVSLELELIYQHPELPTGCESVALTMLLNYYGFGLDKTTIASEYLIYADNFVEGFVGNPFSTGGAGIYSPGLTRTANKFLDAQGSELNAKNVTDSTPEELYRYLAEGKPVVIWNTIYFLQNQPTGQVVKWGEKEYHWDRCEHCMVLSGYDLEKNVVIVHDPINGIIERDADGFWERYESLGSMALIIR